MDTDAVSPSFSDDELAHARALYWRALVQLTVYCDYSQRHGDHVASLMTRFAIGSAIIFTGDLGSWFSRIGQAQFWGTVIIAAQIAAAVFAVLPLPARARGLRTFVATLGAALIEDATASYFERDDGATRQ